MFVIKHRKIFFTISGLLVAGSILAVAVLGLDLGIDFTGGSILEISYSQDVPAVSEVQGVLSDLDIYKATVQPAGEGAFILRMRDLNSDEKSTLDQALNFEGRRPFEEVRFSSLGPSIGQELANKGLIAIGLVVVLIIIFIAIAFSGVSKEISSWKYGVVAVITLGHDVIIPLGVMAILGHYTVAEVDALFLTALLAILGLSVNDTIVVFDRIRENLRAKISPHFEDVVAISLRQTFARSINTSLTTIIVLLALLVMGGETTRYFALTLTVGMAVGTYSSIFLASPLLVTWQKWSRSQPRIEGKEAK